MKNKLLYIGLIFVSLFMFYNVDGVKAVTKNPNKSSVQRNEKEMDKTKTNNKTENKSDQSKTEQEKVVTNETGNEKDDKNKDKATTTSSKTKHCIYERIMIDRTMSDSVITSIKNQDLSFNYHKLYIEIEPVENGIYITKKDIETMWSFKEEKTISEKESGALITNNSGKNDILYNTNDRFANNVVTKDFYRNGNTSDIDNFYCPSIYTANGESIKLKWLTEAINSFKSYSIFSLLDPVSIVPERNIQSSSSVNNENKIFLKELTPREVLKERTESAKTTVSNVERNYKTGCSILGHGKTYTYVKWLITLIRYAAPVLVVIFALIDYLGVVFSGEEKNMKEAQRRAVMRLVAGLILLFIPFLLKFLANISGIFTGIGSDDIFCGFL